MLFRSGGGEVGVDRALRKTYLGTNNYDMGVLMAKHLKGLKPRGGTVCMQLGNVAADNINARYDDDKKRYAELTKGAAGAAATTK